jgi:hypothetical protein
MVEDDWIVLGGANMQIRFKTRTPKVRSVYVEGVLSSSSYKKTNTFQES